MLTLASASESIFDAEEPLIFRAEIVAGQPALSNVALSVILHAVAIAGLFAIPPILVPEREDILASPTEIRIGDSIYFVANLSAMDARKSAAQDQTSKAPASSGPRADAAAEAKPVATHPPVATPKRSTTNAFVPPEIRRDPDATQILAQPQSPPDLIVPAIDLPTFRVAELGPAPRFASDYVVPGRRDQSLPAAPPESKPMDQDLVPPDAAPVQTEAKLVLPSPPVPPPPLPLPLGPLPVPFGDPVDILSLNDRPIPISPRLVVPPGSVAPPTNAGRPDDLASNASATNGGDPNTPSPPALAPGAFAAGSGVGGSSRSSSVAGSQSGTSNAPTAGGGANNAGSGTLSRPATAPGLLSRAGVSPPVVTDSTAKAASAAPKPIVLTRPGNGHFNSIVMQSSPLDQYPESRGLLNHRPIYSVYVSVETAMNWTLFFCIPDSKPLPATAPVVESGTAPAEVKAPFPTRLVRPPVSLPYWQRYVLVHGYVTADGRFDSLSIVKPAHPETDEVLLASLADWEFRAATRDGVPITVEFVLSIPAKGL
jgi:hypothetical protein